MDLSEPPQEEIIAAERKPKRRSSVELNLGNFTLIRTLGTGSFGRVHLAKSNMNQRFYAIKVLRKTDIVKLKQVEHTKHERAILSSIKYSFIVNLWGTFQDDGNLYMVLDYVPGGELFTFMRKCIVSNLKEKGKEKVLKREEKYIETARRCSEILRCRGFIDHCVSSYSECDLPRFKTRKYLA